MLREYEPGAATGDASLERLLEMREKKIKLQLKEKFGKTNGASTLPPDADDCNLGEMLHRTSSSC